MKMMKWTTKRMTKKTSKSFSDEGIFDEDDCDAYNKVWVECHAIEDASTRFHP
jgi:hypothetical protein